MPRAREGPSWVRRSDRDPVPGDQRVVREKVTRGVALAAGVTTLVAVIAIFAWGVSKAPPKLISRKTVLPFQIRSRTAEITMARIRASRRALSREAL